MQMWLTWKAVGRVVAWIAVAFVLVHLLAFFGVFLALAYPVICLLRESKVNRTVFANSLLILLLSLLSLAVIYGESRLLARFGLLKTRPTASFVLPPLSKSHYRLGQIFALQIDVKNVDNPINAIQADLSFDPQVLEVVSISTKDSFAEVFLQKEADNEHGWVRLSGGVPNPGFTGERGVFGTVYFRAKLPGLTTVDYLPSSMVLANDGKGSNILQDLPSTPYLILPERISAEEETLQQQLLEEINQASSLRKTEQLAFYDELSASRVLGATSAEVVQPSYGRQLLEYLGWLDNAILHFWRSVFF